MIASDEEFHATDSGSTAKRYQYGDLKKIWKRAVDDELAKVGATWNEAKLKVANRVESVFGGPLLPIEHKGTKKKRCKFSDNCMHLLYSNKTLNI